MLLLGLAVSLGVPSGPSFGRGRFELFLKLLMAVGVALSGSAILVRAWAVRLVPAPTGGAIPPVLLAGTGGKNDISPR